MNTRELEELIAKCLHDFYDRRIKRIQELKLREFLSKKNPYLFRAIGTEKASEIVEDILSAFISSSDEGIFGDAFFEPITKIASGGSVSPSEGIDVAIETKNRYMAIAVKSGPNWGNAGQLRKQNQDFIALQSRLYKIHKQFDAVIGHGYGRKTGNPKGKIYRNISGQAFWTEITGDPDFYLKLIRLMKDEPQKHKSEYKKAWDAAVNRFTGEFITDFCFQDGRINWEKFVQFVSEDKKNPKNCLKDKNGNNQSMPDT
jgi:hypothetical protein